MILNTITYLKYIGKDDLCEGAHIVGIIVRLSTNIVNFLHLTEKGGFSCPT